MDKHELLIPFILIGILSLSALTATAISSSASYMRLDTFPSVEIGEPLVVSGTTNRADGTQILVTVKGPVELIPAMVRVENGTFNATFDTTGAPVGTYAVKADDGDGHTDEATVEILTAAPTPTPTETATPAPTVAPPTPAPTPAPTVALPTPTTGFEALFAVAGLSAVAYLVLLKKRK